MNRHVVPFVVALSCMFASACSGGSTTANTTTAQPTTSANQTSDSATTNSQPGGAATTAPAATVSATTGAPRPATDAVVGEVRMTTFGDISAVIPPDDCPAAATTTTDAPPVLTRPTKPTVEVPKSPPSELVITDLVAGTGTRKASTGDAISFYYVGYSIPDGTERDSNYSEDQPVTSQLGVDDNLPGFTQGMEGVTAGTRRQIDIPANLALGETGSEQLPADASLTLVIDVVAVRPGPPTAVAADEPDANFPPLPAADQIAYVTERVGDRCALAEPGDQVYINVKVVDAATGDTIESSWDRGRAAVINLDQSGLPGLVEASIGMGVGEVRSVALTPSSGASPAPTGSTSAQAVPGAAGLHYLLEFVGFV